MSHQMNQQRATLRPTNNMTFFDDDDDGMHENNSTLTADIATDDDASSMGRSMTSSVDTHPRSNILVLAEFLASTSPEDFAKRSLGRHHQQQRRASRLLNKFRKRSTTVQITDNGSVSSKGSSGRHIPLPTYHPPSLRDSGVYSEYSTDKDVHYTPSPVPLPPVPASHKKQSLPPPEVSFPMLSPPVIPAKSTARPRRPSPLPEAVASAAIAAASQQFEEQHFHPLRSVPEAALKRRSIVRARHMQQQQQQQQQRKKENDEEEVNANKKANDIPVAQVGVNTCPHCRQRATAVQHADLRLRQRRLSCPPAMEGGDLLDTAGKDKLLRKKIMLLEAQLTEERNTRIRLENVMRQKKAAAKRMEQLEEERRRWKDSRKWMEDRVALLPQ
ncbi:hypothetical protein BX666DRAFT_1914186 [Dichotomocladium elegans]|nr:hypothetical protein BX666DRAFT_1914186 [Dichotomocladium elegans]